MRSASQALPGSMAVFFRSFRPPMPFRPATRMVASGRPACGTNLDSSPCSVPTITTSLFFISTAAVGGAPGSPRLSHSRATAMAGNTWPPVPPPAMSNFIESLIVARSLRRACGARRSLLGLRVLADVEEHAGGQEHHQQTCAAVADERQRDSFGRHQAEDYAEIDERLADDHGGDAEAEIAAEIIRRLNRGAESAPAPVGEKR